MPNDLNVRAPLFDRLAGGRRTLDLRGLHQSLRRELELLLNTRSSFPSQRLPGAPLTVLDYGLPALTQFSSRNPQHQNELAAAMRVAIETYEPRLTAVQVRVVPREDDELFLQLEIDAHVNVDAAREPVSFVIVVDPQKETAAVDVRA